jgi:hypothetical protein
MSPWQPQPKGRQIEQLDEFQLRELRIIKQAILKSALEGGAISDRNKESETFIEDWIKWVYRNEEKDFNLVRKQDSPF